MGRCIFTPLLIVSLLNVCSTSLHAQPKATPQLQKLAVPPAQAKTIATKLGFQYRDVPGVQISPDARSGQLVVMAPEATQKRIANEVHSMLASHASDGAAGGGRPLSLRLKHITWREFEDDLQRLAGGPLPITTSRNGEQAAFQLTALPLQGTTVEVDRRNNSVTVIAPGPSIPGWEKMITVLDNVPANNTHVTELLRLENAEPAPIQRALRLLKELESTRGAETVAATPVGTGSPFRNAVFQQDAAGQAATGEGGDEAIVGTDDEGGAGVIGDTQIQFVPELGTIIIRGAKRDVERVMEVIKQIEEQSKITKPDVEVVELKHADANAVATLLQQLYEDVLSARQGEVSITSLDSPNALLLIGRTEAISGLKELIEKIDQPVAASSRLRVFRLQNASAVDAEQTIRDFFTDRPAAGDDLRPGLGPRVRVLADYRTNSLIVSASPRDMVEVTRLINDLDVQEISAQSEIKIFPLNNAIAEDLAPVLQSAITGEAEDGGNENITPPSTTLSIVSVDSGTAQVLNSGILADAVVTADTGANAIVVRAPAASMPLIGELIRQLDQAPGIDSLVKVFTIRNGDALQLTTALQNLFGDDAATLGTSVGAANLPPSTASADSSLVPLRFSTDQRTNSIVVSGSADDLDVVESILIRLDSEGFADRITEVIWLRHQAAEDVAGAIQQYVQQRITTVNTIQQFQQGLGPYDLPDRDLIVVPEPVSNSVLLSVSPRLYPDVRGLIDKLDRRPPMVLIKVMLAEVRLDDEFEIGGEIGLQDSLLYDRNIAAGSFPGATPPSNPGFDFNGNGLGPTFDSTTGLPIGNSFGQGTVASRGVSSFGLGATNSTLGYGGLVLSAASDSLSLLFRTLQDAQRFQVLSRPQIMTMDNTEGFVQVGRLIARVTDVINNGISGTQVVTEDIEVGLILSVRPRVGADGLIIMDVDITRSERDDDAGTPVPTGVLGEVVIINDILRTTAQSVVAAYSGQTVVFGGLIQKTRINTSRRVPFVSDIPLLGHMFKFDREAEQRRETLAFLTPMLVTGEEDLQYVKETETRRMSWCLADVVEAHGDEGVSGGNGLWGPAAGTTIYPDLQPTVDSPSVLVEDDGAHEVPGSEIIISDGPLIDSSQPSSAPQPPAAAPGDLPSPSDAPLRIETLELSTPTPDAVPKTYSEGVLPPPKSVPQELPPPAAIPPQSRVKPGDSDPAKVSESDFSSIVPQRSRQASWIDVAAAAQAEAQAAAASTSTWKKPEKPSRLPQP
jgi:type II secretory pathway component GspD/PulD (secretin)